MRSSSAIVKDCIFNGGAIGTLNGINGELGASAVINDCSFGQTTSHTTQDIALIIISFVKCRNCTFDKATLSVVTGSIISSEDDDGVKGANKNYITYGTVTKDTGVVRSGGASSSAKMEPNSNCGLYAPLSVTPFNEYDFKIYCSAVETTVTICMRSFGVWTVYPTAALLYIEASYLSHTTTATRTTIASTDVLADETTWVGFDVTFTPLQAGFVYLKVYLKKYQSSKGCYVDIKPITV